jgi:small subunit ribosomal protein S8
MSNQIANCVSILSNGQKMRKHSIFLPCTKIILGIVKVLKSGGYILSFRFAFFDQRTHLEVFLKLVENPRLQNNFSAVSRPSLPKNFSRKALWDLKKKVGLFILSTSLGILSDKEARLLRVGGNVLIFAC